MGDIRKSVLECIGNTPIVEISRLCKKYGVEGRILVKLEMLNPGASKKDRIALYMIEEAERKGLLKPGQTVVEETSGNTGNGLAVVCAVKGYPFVAAMSKGNSLERMQMMKGLGADLLLVDQLPTSPRGSVTGADLKKVEEAAIEFAEKNGAFLTNQFYNPDNSMAHEKGTAREIWEQTDGKIDYFVDFVGTGGTYAGIAKGLKAYNKNIKCFVVEPEKGGVYGGHTPSENPIHVIQGGGYAVKRELVDETNVDGSVLISDQECTQTTRELAAVEAIFGGFSAGANVRAAIKLLQGEARGKTIVCLANDTGLKYLSTKLYQYEINRESGASEIIKEGMKNKKNNC
ncbi:MAG: cysteine synthase family protein [Spirochaetales bacterium]|jgi:cysteine synthase A|nr:cysteine synthase family protein [Spirochaetales bacterium]